MLAFGCGCAPTGVREAEAPPAVPHPGGNRCFAGECHTPVAQRLATLKRPHGPLKESARACEACHVLHGDASPGRRTRERVEALCARCHAEIGGKIRASRFRHTPIDRQGCTACHAPHGTDWPDLLDNPPPHLEMEYDPTNRRFCTKSCHARARYLDAGNAESGFRDGSRSLHWVHTTWKKVRGCNACHDTHASDQPFQIRPDVPFGTGGWKLPIAFTPTATGGSCVVGCHRPQSYSRARPAGRTGLDVGAEPASASSGPSPEARGDDAASGSRAAYPASRYSLELERAAEAGDARARAALAFAYRRGVGTPKDVAKALE